jgi:hypothetical protein
MSTGTLQPKPFATSGAGDRQVIEGVIVNQQNDWWLRVDGSAALWGPVKNPGKIPAGTTACVAVGQQGTLYVVSPSGSVSGGGDSSGNIDGGEPDSVYGGLPIIDGNGV